MDPHDAELMIRLEFSGIAYKLGTDYEKEGIGNGDRRAKALYLKKEDFCKAKELDKYNKYTGAAWFENLAQVIWGA